MKVTMNTIIAVAAATLVGMSIVPSVQAQQPSTTPAPQTTPAQPGPAMGQQQMMQGMEHGKAGQNMGKQMEEKSHQQGTDHATMGHSMMQQPGTTQPPTTKQ